MHSLPNPHYIDLQDELTWAQRCKVVNWLISLHHKFRLVPETLFLAVNVVDRMLSMRSVSLARLQLLAAAALFLAAKYEEVLAPSVENFAYVALASEEDVLQAERYILGTLNFDLSYPNPMNFLRRISKADAYDIQTRTVAKYLMEISTLDARLLSHPPSAIAGASLYLAREVLERGSWTPTLVHYSGYAEDELLATANILLDYTLRPTEKTHKALFVKYSSQRFMRASTYVRRWAQRAFPAANEHYEHLARSSSTLLHVSSLAVDLYSILNIRAPSGDDMRELFGCPPATPQPSEHPLPHLPAEQDAKETKQLEFAY